jgi:hypothetical protein
MMQVKFKNDAPQIPGLKFGLIFSAIMGYALTITGLIQIICLLLKFKGYKLVMDAMGNNYLIQLPLGIGFLVCYYLLRRGLRLQRMKSANDGK